MDTFYPAPREIPIFALAGLHVEFGKWCGKGGAPAPLQDQIYLGASLDGKGAPLTLHLSRANRHGLIAGATGGGKTVTLQVLAEGFSKAGVPVLLTDIKGDLAGLSQHGHCTPAFSRRWQELGRAPEVLDGLPVVFWDVLGQAGHAVRLSVIEMGPMALARLLDLTEAQDGVLNIAFRIAQDQNLPLVNLTDLRAILFWIAEHTSEIILTYGNVASASIGGIQRRLIALENEGIADVFGEPGLQLDDFLALSDDGFGQVNILAAARLMRAPRLYAAVLIRILTGLYEQLPEVGDEGKPRFVLFFDEAHLLFKGAPKPLVEKIEQITRLIRSKGVGIFFVTQSPADIPGTVLSQLGNRVLHALRGYTPRDQKSLRAAAETFRVNSAFDTAMALKGLGIGEALVSTLEESGEPSVVQRGLIRPPATKLGAIDTASRHRIVEACLLKDKYKLLRPRKSAEGGRGVPAEAVVVARSEGKMRLLRGQQLSSETAFTPAARAYDHLPRRAYQGFAHWVDERHMRAQVVRIFVNAGRRLIRSLRSH